MLASVFAYMQYIAFFCSNDTDMKVYLSDSFTTCASPTSVPVPIAARETAVAPLSPGEPAGVH